MKTIFLLMAQYEGRTLIPVEWVVRDYFRHLDVGTFARKVSLGDIKLPIVRIEGSQKSAKAVHINDLADHIDKQTAAAHKEWRQLAGAAA